MSVLDDLLAQMSSDAGELRDLSATWSNGTLELPVGTARVVFEIARAAFEIKEPLDSEDGKCMCCSKVNHETFLREIPHDDNCPWFRIQELRKRLKESADLEKAIVIVGDFDTGRRDSYDEAMEIFRSLVNREMSLSEMESVFYNLFERLMADGYDQRKSSGVMHYIRLAWEGIGDWHFWK